MGVLKQFAMNIITSFNTGNFSIKWLYFYFKKLLSFITLLTIAFSCSVSNTLELKPKVTFSQDLKKLPISIGYYHSPDFMAFKDSTTIDKILPVGGYRSVSRIYPLGTSSDAIFKSIYPDIFKSALPVNDTMSYQTTGIDFILKPEIVSFQYTTWEFVPETGDIAPDWVEIIYLFKLFNPDGKEVASWKTAGWGKYQYRTPHPLQAPVNEAMNNAAIKFANSFDRVPEVKRCINGLSLENITITPEIQETVMSPQDVDSTFTSGYMGKVSARIKHEFVHKLPQSNKYKVIDTIGVDAFDVFLINEGQNRLYVDPVNISWIPIAQKEVYPISRGALSGFYVDWKDYVLWIPPTEDEPEIHDEIDLVFHIVGNFLFNSPDPIQMKRKAEYLLRRTYFNREVLPESILNSHTSIAGRIYFPTLRDGPVSGVLEIPVIDLDTATRYIIRFEIPIDSKRKEINFTDKALSTAGKGLGTF